MANDITFACLDCGSTEFVFPNDPPQDDDIISCNGCGKEIGRYADIQEATIEAGKAEVDKWVEDAFGKGVKPTWTKK